MTGELIALASAALYALSGVAIARGASEGRSGDNGAFLSVVLTAILSLGLWLATDAPGLPVVPGGSVWSAVGLFVAAGVFSTVLGRIAMFRSVGCGGAIRASMLRRLTPLFAAAFAALLLRELPGSGSLAGMALILGGAAMLGGQATAQATRPGWVSWGVGSAAAYGFSYVLRKMALVQMPAAALGALIGALTGLGWYVLATAARPQMRRAVTGVLRDTGPWQFVAAAAMALGQIGQFLALQRTSVATVALLGSTETVLSILLAGWIFRTEARPGRLVWAGAAVSTAGVVLVALQTGA